VSQNATKTRHRAARQSFQAAGVTPPYSKTQQAKIADRAARKKALRVSAVSRFGAYADGAAPEAGGLA